MTMQKNIPPRTAETETEKMLRLLTKTLGRIVDGNRLTAGQVRLVSFDESKVILTGNIAIKISPIISESQVADGTTKGEVLSNKEEIMVRAFGLSQEFLNDPNIQQTMAELLRKNPEKGFNEKGFEHKLSDLPQQTFSTIDICGYCQGRTFVSCHTCQASGYIGCHMCHNDGRMACMSCHSSGQIQNAQGGTDPCHSCHGQGTLSCTQCHGDGRIHCTQCHGDGRGGCTQCNQSGKLTHHYHLGWQAEGQSELFASENMPAEVRTFIHKKTLGKIISEKHAQIDMHIPERKDDENLTFAMNADMPLINAVFSVEGKTIPATIIGYRGRILKMEPFLDAVIKPGIESLLTLSKGAMASEALMEKACKFRIIRDTISGLEHHSQKWVYQKIKKEYPFVLSDGYAQSLVKYAYRALRAFSQGSRRMGLAVGTGLSFIFGFLYFKMGGVEKTHAFLNTQNVGQHAAIMDLICWGIVYVLALFLLKKMTLMALKKKLPAHLQTKERGLPEAGIEGLILVVTTFVGFMLFSWI